jgi:serine protease Do
VGRILPPVVFRQGEVATPPSSDTGRVPLMDDLHINPAADRSAGCGRGGSMSARRLGLLFSTLALTLTASCTGSRGNTLPPDHPCDQGGFSKVVEDSAPSVVTVLSPQGVGSGVVFKADTVLTNQHVVHQNSEVRVGFADGKEARAVVVAADPTSDIAVLRTDRKNLAPARFATESPRQGCLALAIGSPLGFQNSVTAGVVSGLHRSLPADVEGQLLVDLIQTDAPISPGNSGGALLDVQGQVIGINEAYIPPQAGAVSLGFAIPAPTAVDVGEQLLARGSVTRAYLGVSVGELTPSIRDRLGVPGPGGALVLGVEADSPAAKAGVQPGDVIVRAGDVAVNDVDDLLAELRKRKPQEEIVLVVNRNGAPKELRVVLATQR